VADDAVELLERQCAFLLAQNDLADFLVGVGPFLDVLAAEPRIAPHLDDLRNEALAIFNAQAAVEEQLLPELRALRDDFARLAPDLDDSQREPAHETSEPPSPLRIDVSLARFDEVAKGEPSPIGPDGSGGRGGELIRILQAKAQEVYRRAEETGQAEPEGMDDWSRRLGNADSAFGHARRATVLRSRTSAGLSLMRLGLVPEALNPRPIERPPGQEPGVYADQMFRWVVGGERPLFAAVHEPLDDSARSWVEDRVDEFRSDVARLREELRRRIGTTRSRLGLVQRFKHRCEWHDRERLEALASDDSVPGGPEDRLTAELARYLFDQGLAPLTKPMTGGLEPDLLDPQQPAVYVEAKQYSDSSNARRDLRQAVRQVYDTVGRLLGTPYAVTEAFCVVFRRGGPRYLLPDVLPGEGYRLHLVLVDIAPASESGRRQQRQPILLTVEELLGT